MESELVSLNLGELNTDLVAGNLEDSAADLDLLVVAALVLGDHVELDLVLGVVDLGLDSVLLEVHYD